VKRGQRIAIIAVFVAVAVAGFVIAASGGSDDDSPSSSTTTPPVGVPTATDDQVSTETTPGETQEAPKVLTIEVKDGKPVGGVQKIKVKNGDTVEFRVESQDTTDEIHIHGYDLKGEIAPGQGASFSFEAKIEGIFEIELEDAGQQIASLEVRP
jgi:FtsP/CotA-like multicopper oxidase with cupredoxin domain